MLLPIFTTAGCQSAQIAVRPPPVEVCQVMDRVAEFDGKVVRLRGEVFTNFREFSGLRDSKCSSPLLPFGPVSAPPEGNKELEAALYGRSGSGFGSATATVIGRVRARPGQVPNVVVEVERFEEIERK